MKKYIFSIIAISGMLKGYSQEGLGLSSQSFPYNLASQVAKAKYENIKGSYFVFDAFRQGSIVLKNDQKYKDMQINYDAYSENVVVKNETAEYETILKKDWIKSFTVNEASGKEARFVKINIENKPVFAVELVKDSISLYYRYSKILKKAGSEDSYGSAGASTSEFVSANEYYVNTAWGIQKLQNSKKGILKLFPEYESELSDFIKEKNIDLKDTESILSLFIYINELKKAD